MKKFNLTKSACCAAVLGAVVISPFATAGQLEEVVVTARKRTESLQDIPDSITAFTAADIQSAGIDDVQDFIDLTPNITLRETFRAGVTFITIRGITTGQQGWAPVTYVVDGVPAASLDAINQGALIDIERIEVLKGPQSALYGAGAIAGAINVITKEPTDEFEGAVKLSVGNGSDVKASAVVSGPINDNWRYRLNTYVRDSDGILESTDGVGLDFEEQETFRGRLTGDLGNVKLDFRASVSDITAGAATQEALPVVGGVALIDEFDTSLAPGPARGIIGTEDREFKEFSFKLDWELDAGTLTAVAGYSDLQQELFGSTSWTKPVAGGSELGVCPAPLSIGGPGESPDCYQHLVDNFEATTFDIRFASPDDQPFRWLVGYSRLDREVENLLDVGAAVLNANGAVVIPNQAPFFVDVRNAEIEGFYGQITYDITDKLEVTAALRRDTNNFDTTRFTNLDRSVLIPAADGSRILREEDSGSQPKLSLAYTLNDDWLIFGTVSRGFRSGFFNTGSLTQEEETDNIELGFKSTLADGRVRLNGSVFKTDYSEQQFTSVVAAPPFRLTTNLPETDITGLELELTALITDRFDINIGLGVTDAEVNASAGVPAYTAPGTPDYTLNTALKYEYPLANGWNWKSRLDWRRQGEQFIALQEQFKVEEKDYVDLRTGFENDDWTITLYMDNATDERQANDFSNFGFTFVRSNNKPRAYGVELAYRF